MKKHIRMFTAGICLLCVIIFTVIIVKNTSEVRQYTEQMELGEKYLAELDYESAIVAYTTAIEIDPKCEEAYIRLAEVYMATGDNEKALQVLEEGYQQTASEGIQAKLEELKGRMLQESSGNTAKNNETVQPTIKSETTKTEREFVDHVMDWQDENLEKAMREITGIWDRDIMLSDVWEMTELDIDSGNIVNISALSELINLESLSIYNNEISDITPLGSLTKLRSLAMHHNEISDIEALKNLNKLEFVGMSYNNISDISALANLKELEHIVMANNNIEDISALSNLKQLEHISMGYNRVNDVTPLKELYKLTELNLNSNRIENIDALENLIALEHLWLDSASELVWQDTYMLHGRTEYWRNSISDISALKNLTNLRWLYLGCNEISDISVLSGLTKLEILYLDDNNISDIGALGGLTNIKYLGLGDNNISRINSLEKLSDLEILWLNDNNISDISVLANLKKLEKVSLYDNPIYDWTPVLHVEYVVPVIRY